MPCHKVIVPKRELSELNAVFASIRSDNNLIVDFPPEVQQYAAHMAANPPLPDQDCTDIPFVTIDPPSSMDLDQAVYMERSDNGYIVYYAIADVPAFVELGSVLDTETLKRGETIYTPDVNVALHPTILSENAASLLPDQIRSAYVWKFDLDHDANVLKTDLQRAKVKSQAKLNYDIVLQEIEKGTAEDNIALLKEIGIKRLALEEKRGGVSLNTPTEEIDHDGKNYVLNYRAPAPSEAWNAQISLMTGMEAAKIMIEGKVGILRTMPAPAEENIQRLRRIANALHQSWKENVSYGDYIKTLNPENPKHAAILYGASALFTGAAYTYFDGQLPELTTQAAVAAPYAHTTAPLRRLVDRFVLPICDALKNNKEIPQELKDTAAKVPDILQASDVLASKVNKECIHAVEAAVLKNRVGETFQASLLSIRDKGKQGIIQIHDPAIEANCKGPFNGKDTLNVKLLTADVETYSVKFANADAPENTQENQNSPENTTLHVKNPKQTTGQSPIQTAHQAE
ncbi:MAG: RNB domain-containing ribonuclease [Micrococcaceae bacterium]